MEPWEKAAWEIISQAAYESMIEKLEEEMAQLKPVEVRWPKIGGKNNVIVRFYVAGTGLHVGVCADTDEEARELMRKRYPTAVPFGAPKDVRQDALLWRGTAQMGVDELLTNVGQRISSKPYTVLVWAQEERRNGEWPEILGSYATEREANTAINDLRRKGDRKLDFLIT